MALEARKRARLEQQRQARGRGRDGARARELSGERHAERADLRRARLRDRVVLEHAARVGEHVGERARRQRARAAGRGSQVAHLGGRGRVRREEDALRILRVERVAVEEVMTNAFEPDHDREHGQRRALFVRSREEHAKREHAADNRHMRHGERLSRGARRSKNGANGAWHAPQVH